MPSKIRVLTEHTINKIAAGEVIENPSSVVKELVENSLDAGASEIFVEIRGGGRQLIRITDNGCGMNADDALLCLERHATSKLRQVEDIHFLDTMGFRGEAIPSIASISKFTLMTSPQESEKPDDMGTMVIVDGGKIVSCNPVACAKGTTMEVKSLFFNVPVRKKFLKSPVIDANEILKMLSVIALGNPHIKFDLINDGKTVLKTNSGGVEAFKDNLKERVVSILGEDFVQNALWIEGHHEKISIQGFIGVPSNTRHNRSSQYLFINRRGVTLPLISFALKDGYGTALAQGRHPVFVLHMTIPGELVDVNVHPQKKEVRLRQEQLIREIIVKAVRRGLQGSVETEIIRHVPFSAPAEIPYESVDRSYTTESSYSPVAPSFHPSFAPQTSFVPQAERFTTSFSSKSVLPWEEMPTPQPFAKQQVVETPLPTLSFQVPPSTACRVLATIPGYIIVDGSSIALLNPAIAKSSLILVDQKTAHMRVIYERLLQKKEGQLLAQQTLLVPFSLEMPQHEADALRTNLAMFHSLGISIKEFGQRSFLVDAIPQVFGNSNVEVLIREAIHELGENTHSSNWHQEHIKRLAVAAGRAAVSNERKMTLEEAQSLLSQLMLCQERGICPLGRPTFVSLTQEEIQKLLMRAT